MRIGKHIVGQSFLPAGFWVRVFGYGISATNSRVVPPLFSVRYGHTKALWLGPWYVKLLKPYR